MADDGWLRFPASHARSAPVPRARGGEALVLDQYPYLGASLLLLGAFWLAVLACRGQRRLACLSALLEAPFAPLALACIPRYWSPARVATLGGTGPEDVITAFATGGLAWVFAYGFVSRPVRFRVRLPVCARRYLAVACAGFVLYVPLGVELGLSVSTASTVAMALTSAGLLWLRPGLWAHALAAGCGFCVVHIVVLWTAFWLWPSFLGQWNLANLWGVYILGLPLDEPVWAFCAAFTWAVFIGYAFDAQQAEGAPKRGEVAETCT